MAEDAKDLAQVKQRSPEHPGVSLKEALGRAQEFYKHESFNYASVDVAKAHWGYGPVSSSGLRLLAALIHYGLLEEQGAGAQRRVRLTALAKAILVDRREDSTERSAALRKAALNPKLIKTLWDQWGPNIPSDPSMEFDLIQKYKFNPGSVRSFIRDFKETVTYAGLAQSSSLLNSQDKADERGAPAELPKPWDFPGVFSPFNTTPPRATMPSTQQDQGAVPLDLPIPLRGGRRAVLRIPTELSQAEYELILDMVKDTMEKMRPMIVTPEPVAGPNAS